MFLTGLLARRCISSRVGSLDMPTLTTGRRVRADKHHVIVYAGKASLLALLDEAQDSFLNLFEEAARLGCVPEDFELLHDVAVSHIVIKYDVPQSPR